MASSGASVVTLIIFGAILILFSAIVGSIAPGLSSDAFWLGVLFVAVGILLLIFSR